MAILCRLYIEHIIKNRCILCRKPVKWPFSLFELCRKLYPVFKLYSWHKCKFEKSRKYAVSSGFLSLYLHLFSAIFSFIFYDCPFEGFEGVGDFLINLTK